MADFAGAAAAIRTLIEAGKPDGLDLAWPNEASPLDDSSILQSPAWAMVEVVGTDAGIRGIGKPGEHVVVEDGLVFATVFVQSGMGVTAAFQLAGQLGEILRVKEFYAEGPGVCVRTWTPRISAGGSRSEDGAWFGVSVTIPFEFWRRA